MKRYRYHIIVLFNEGTEKNYLYADSENEILKMSEIREALAENDLQDKGNFVLDGLIKTINN